MPARMFENDETIAQNRTRNRLVALTTNRSISNSVLDADLLAPRRRARQQQVGDIGAGDQENQPDYGHQQNQWIGVVLAH